MSIAVDGVETQYPFLDLEGTIFPYLKDLNRPSLSTLYERIEKLRHVRWGLYAGASICAIGGLVTFFFQPIAACTLEVLALASLVTSIFFHKPPPYLILGIDGGGIRGMIPIQILALIEKELGCRIGEVFDCIAGTSIGGILALSLTQPDPNNPSKPKRGAQEAAEFLEKEGPVVFARTRFQVLSTGEGIWAPKYSNENLKQILQREFQDEKMENAVTDILIPSYDLTKGKPVIFFHFKGDRIQNSLTMKDVGMGTAAAPIYFPSYPVKDNGHALNLVDGGIIANNPTLLAYMKANGHIDPCRDIFILSIGTGQITLRSITPLESEKYGMIRWLPIIFDLIFQSTEEMLTLHFKLIKHVKDVSLSLIRLQPQLETQAQEQLDNGTPENIQALKNIATRYFEENRTLIEQEIIQPLKKYRVPSQPSSSSSGTIASCYVDKELNKERLFLKMF